MSEDCAEQAALLADCAPGRRPRSSRLVALATDHPPEPAKITKEVRTR